MVARQISRQSTVDSPQPTRRLAPLQAFAIGSINVYQKTLSPDHGWFKSRHPFGVCRFQPTCSEYAKEAIERYGLIKGSILSLKRVSRCHPWGDHGHDPVPGRVA